MDDVISYDYPHNFNFYSLDIATWLFGVSFISITAILPVYARHITDFPVIISLTPALADFGCFFPQQFLALFVERLPRKYPLVLWLGALEYLPYLILPIAILTMDGLPR